MRRRDPHRRAIEIVERLIRHDRDDLGTPTAQPRVLLDREQAMRAGNRAEDGLRVERHQDRKSTRLNSSHPSISYAVFCLKKKKNQLAHFHLKNKKNKNV